MNGKLFLIHWDQTEAAVYAGQFKDSGWQVDYEYEDGARAGRRIKQDPPDVVVIYLNRLPSHGRETGQWLSTQKATNSIQLVFVDGKASDVEKTRNKLPDAIFTSSASLSQVLL